MYKFKKFNIVKVILTSLVASMVSVVSVPASHASVSDTNISPSTLAANTYLFVATENSTSAAVLGDTSATDTVSTAARSFNLKYKDSMTPATGIAQTATVLTGGALSLYAGVATSVAISATGGTITASASASTVASAGNASTTAVAFTLTADIAAGTAVAVRWSAPSTEGIYTISMSVRRGTADITATAPLAGFETSTIRVNVVSDSHPAVNGSNKTETLGAINGSLFVGVATNTAATATRYTVSSTVPGGDSGESEANESTALSRGLLYKDSTYRTAQTATVLVGGVLSLYAVVSTSAAFTTNGGSFSDSAGTGSSTATYSSDLKTSLITGAAGDKVATTVAALWTAPTTAGTYSVSLYVHDGITAPTLTAPAVTLAGAITVTVVASSAGGTAVAANGTCVTDNTDGAITSTADDTDVVTNGNPWYIKYILRDAYLAPLSSGNLVATATNGALISIGSGTQSAGTGSTVVAYGTGAAGSSYDAVRVDQPTSGAPLTTTVTITYNGATVCTKTVTIRGAADKMIIGSVGSVKIGGSTANANWLADGTNRDAHYTITLQDSAGNTVLPSSETEFSADSASLTTTVTALAVDSGDIATSTSSSTAAWNYSVGKFTCGPVAGTSKVTLKHTSASTGKIITAAFDARCAGDAYTYTASFDKASYTQGEIATLTVKFLDSKGNAANSQTALGASEMILPMMTFVSATGAASALAKADGTKAYTLTVGTTSGMTAGTYSGIIDFTGLTAVAATKQTVTYKLSTGGDTTTNADVLKSIVALIASINKQIQALQKLILKR